MSATAAAGISFTVRGHPSPQGSKRALVHRSTGRAVVMESAGQPLRDWRADVKAAAARAHAGPPLAGPLALSVSFTLPKPASAPKRRRTWPQRRPDLDKLLRAVLDALTGIIFADDAQVVQLDAGKNYPGEGPDALPWPGAAIAIGFLEG